MNSPHVGTIELPVNGDPELKYDVEDSIFRYHSSKNQWSNFDRILQNAKLNAVANSGVCEIVISEVGALKETIDSALPYFSYTFRVRENGTIAMSMTPNEAISSPEQDIDISNLSTLEAISIFEQRVKQRLGLQHVRTIGVPEVRGKFPPSIA